MKLGPNACQSRNFLDVAEPFSELSDRGRQVIALVCDGLSNKEIARKLGVTEGTIKAHLHVIYEKLSVRSRFETIIALAHHTKSEKVVRAVEKYGPNGVRVGASRELPGKPLWETTA